MKLIVIDVQKGIMKEDIYMGETVLSNIGKLVESARKNGTEVIFIRHDRGECSDLTFGQEDHNICDEIKPLSSEKVFDKNINSMFGNAELKSYLLSSDDRDLMITGLKTNFCIDASIKSAFDLGFKVTVPEYCNSTTGSTYMSNETTYRYYNELIWPGRFAEMVTVEKAAEMLNK